MKEDSTPFLDYSKSLGNSDSVWYATNYASDYREHFAKDAIKLGYDCFNGDYQVLAMGHLTWKDDFIDSIMSRNMKSENPLAKYGYYLMLLRKGKDFYKFAITTCSLPETCECALFFGKISKIEFNDLLVICSIQEVNSKPLYLSLDLAVSLVVTPNNTADGYTELTENKLCPIFGNPFLAADYKKYVSIQHGQAEWILRKFDSHIGPEFREPYMRSIEKRVGKPYKEIAEEGYALFIKSREENYE